MTQTPGPNKPNARRKFRPFVTLFFIVMVFNFALRLSNRTATDTKSNTVTTASSSIEPVWIYQGEDSISAYLHERQWRDNYGKSYAADLAVRTKDVLRLQNQLDDFHPEPNKPLWGALYGYFVENDQPSLDLVLDAFYRIYQSEQLSPDRFADMVVSCIQDIPYALVFQDPCLGPEAYEKWMNDLLVACPDCCIGNQPYGIQSPVAFIQTLKGDCDTRTVLIFSILSAFNFDVAILNSESYRHSILGINLPAAGQYKLFRGKKYMAWETTAKFYPMGSLPQSISNMDLWHVVLTNKP